MTRENVVPGLESFWETCDKEEVGEHPLMRELCYRLDAIQHYRSLIQDAEFMGDDDAVAQLSKQFDQQQAVVRRLRDELQKIGTATA